MSPSSILIAGSTGFLGDALVRQLRASGAFPVRGMRASRMQALPDRERHGCIAVDTGVDGLREQLVDHNVRTVINCVTDYGRGRRRLTALLASNLHLPVRLLEACQGTDVQQFLNCNTSLPPEVNAYALAKTQFSEWLRGHSTVARRVDVMLEYFYGEREPGDRLVSRLVQVAVDPLDRMPLSPGGQRRDFLHVDDVCRGIEMMMTTSELEDGYHRVELGSGTALSLRELGMLISRVAGSVQGSMQFGALPYRDNEIMYSCADIQPMQQLGWTPQIPLEQGLSRCVEHLRCRRRVA